MVVNGSVVDEQQQQRQQQQWRRRQQQQQQHISVQRHSRATKAEDSEHIVLLHVNETRQKSSTSSLMLAAERCEHVSESANEWPPLVPFLHAHDGANMGLKSTSILDDCYLFPETTNCK